MSATILFDYNFEEWGLKENSRIPGWSCIEGFLEKSLSTKQISYAFGFEFDPKRKQYTPVLRFDKNNIQGFKPTDVKEFLWKDTLFIIKSTKIEFSTYFPLYYVLENRGILTDNQKSSVFPMPINWDKTHLNQGEIFLVIHHDGDPVFVLNK